MRTASYIRTVAAISLMLNAVLSVVSITLMPALSSSTADNLAAMNAASTMTAIS